MRCQHTDVSLKKMVHRQEKVENNCVNATPEVLRSRHAARIDNMQPKALAVVFVRCSIQHLARPGVPRSSCVIALAFLNRLSNPLFHHSRKRFLHIRRCLFFAMHCTVAFASMNRCKRTSPARHMLPRRPFLLFCVSLELPYASVSVLFFVTFIVSVNALTKQLTTLGRKGDSAACVC